MSDAEENYQEAHETFVEDDDVNEVQDEEPAPPTTKAGIPTLPPRRAVPRASAAAAVSAGGPGQSAPMPPLDPKLQKVRAQVQSFRTNIYRAAMRLRYPVASQMINQVMFRLQMAEKIHLETHAAGVAQTGGDLEGEALEEAERLEGEGGPALDFSATVLVLGMAGVGKTATLHNLLGIDPLSGYHATESVQVLRGEVNGIGVTFIDTPGLNPGPSSQSSNLRILHAAKKAFNKHKPHAVLYMDRMDSTRRDQAFFSQQNCKSASTNTTSSVTKITAGAAICAAFLAGADASHAS